MHSLFFFSLFLVNGIVADPTKSIVETAMATESLSDLVTILTAKGYEPLLKALNGSGTFTVFAPDNAAFAASDLDIFKVEKVTAILNYHVLGSVMNSSQLNGLHFPETLSKNPKYVNVGDEKGQVLFVEGSKGNVSIYFSDKVAKVFLADIVCTNGVVHIIDQVITLPPLTTDAVKWSGLTDLVAAVVKANLTDAVDNTTGITLFAPTNAAFAAAGINISNTTGDQLIDILKYHVVPTVAYTPGIEDGQNFTTLEGANLTLTHKEGTNDYQVNGAHLTTANVLIKNGVAHFIDNVLIPKKTNNQVLDHNI